MRNNRSEFCLLSGFVLQNSENEFELSRLCATKVRTPIYRIQSLHNSTKTLHYNRFGFVVVSTTNTVSQLERNQISFLIRATKIIIVELTKIDEQNWKSQQFCEFVHEMQFFFRLSPCVVILCESLKFWSCTEFREFCITS